MNSALPATNQVLTPDEIIDLQMRGMLQQAHDAYVAYFHANEIDFALLSLFRSAAGSLARMKRLKTCFATSFKQPHLLRRRTPIWLKFYVIVVTSPKRSPFWTPMPFVTLQTLLCGHCEANFLRICRTGKERQTI